MQFVTGLRNERAEARSDLYPRQAPGEHRRRSLVSLTNDRRAAVEAFVALGSEPLVRALETLSPTDRKGFVNGLTAWAKRVSTYR